MESHQVSVYLPDYCAKDQDVTKLPSITTQHGYLCQSELNNAPGRLEANSKKQNKKEYHVNSNKFILISFEGKSPQFMTGCSCAILPNSRCCRVGDRRYDEKVSSACCQARLSELHDSPSANLLTSSEIRNLQPTTPPPALGKLFPRRRPTFSELGLFLFHSLCIIDFTCPYYAVPIASLANHRAPFL